MFKKRRNMLDPKRVAHNEGGILARLWRQFVIHPFTKGKDDGIYNNFGSRLREVKKVHNSTTIENWAYADSLTHNAFFTLLTVFLGGNKIYFTIELRHREYIREVLGIPEYTKHSIVYQDSKECKIADNKDNITNLMAILTKDLHLMEKKDELATVIGERMKIEESLKAKEVGAYKTKLKRFLIVDKLSWANFIAIIYKMLMVKAYRIVITVEFTKMRFSMTETLTVNIEGKWGDGTDRENNRDNK